MPQHHWSTNSEGTSAELNEESGKVRLARATAALIAKRKQEINGDNPEAVRESVNAVVKRARQMKRRSNLNDISGGGVDNHESDLIDLTKRIDQKILSNNVNKSRQ